MSRKFRIESVDRPLAGAAVDQRLVGTELPRDARARPKLRRSGERGPCPVLRLAPRILDSDHREPPCPLLGCQRRLRPGAGSGRGSNVDRVRLPRQIRLARHRLEQLLDRRARRRGCGQGDVAGLVLRERLELQVGKHRVPGPREVGTIAVEEFRSEPGKVGTRRSPARSRRRTPRRQPSARRRSAPVDRDRRD